MRAPLLIALLLSACAASRPGPAPAGDPLAQVSAAELLRRGQLLAEAGDLTRAEHYLLASIERGESEARVMPILIRVCVRASRLVAALTYAEPYLTRHPDDWALRLLVATIHMALEEPEVARRHLTLVLTTAPEEPPQAHFLLAVLYRDALERPDASVVHFERYLALAPDGVHAAEARASVAEARDEGPVRLRELPAVGEAEGATP